jgi:hypothetical protein
MGGMNDTLRLARERYKQGVDGDRQNRDLDQLQRAFYRGRLEDQWDKGDLEKRKGRITVAVNRVPQFVKQITNEIRQNKPAIRVLPVDDQTDPKLAEVYTAIIRHIESQSDGHRVYSRSAEQAVIGGIGWFRLLTDYADGQSFDQEIYIKGIRNPLAVVVDPGAVEATRCDMQWAFVSEMVSEEHFKELYPDASLAGFDSDEDWVSEWRLDDQIRIAEYWTREKESRDLVLLTDGSTLWADDIDEALALALQQQGIGIAATRKADDWKVKCQKITATEVLEEFEWAGSYIPLIPVIGEEIEVGDDVFRHGMVYPLMDSQRAYNFARSAMLETVASQPKAPFLVTTAMVAAHKKAWEKLNEGNPPVLTFDPDPLQPGGPQRLSPPNFSAAWYQEAQVADGDMKATTGIYDASLGERSNETSGRAIMARDQQGETANFNYVDNLTAAIRHCGKLLIELIPRIYTNRRIIRIMGEDGEMEGFARINTMLPDGQLENDISVGQFDLEVTTGPSFATKRMEAADKMMALVQSVPAIGQVGADMIVKALDMPYGDKLAERLAMVLVPPGTDIELDQKRMQMQQAMQQMQGPQPPDPAQELQMQMMMGQVAELKAKIENMTADTALKAAKVEETQVSTAISVQEAEINAFKTGAELAKGDGSEARSA